MKLMLSATYEYLKEKEVATFDEIFNHIKEGLGAHWQEVGVSRDPSKIDKIKRGELFTYLTLDGRFVKINDEKWGLIENFSRNEIKKMRININEMPDE